MKQYYIKYFFTIILFSIRLNSRAQIATEEKLLGCWKAIKFEFIKPVEDSATLINGMKNYISCFEKDGKFTTNIKAKKSLRLIGSGTYSISLDGRTIYQKRTNADNGVNSPGEVVIFNDRELAIKVDNVILHFIKINN